VAGWILGNKKGNSLMKLPLKSSHQKADLYVI